MCQKRVSPNSWAVSESNNSAKFGKYKRYQNCWRLRESVVTQQNDLPTSPLGWVMVSRTKYLNNGQTQATTLLVVNQIWWHHERSKSPLPSTKIRKSSLQDCKSFTTLAGESFMWEDKIPEESFLFGTIFCCALWVLSLVMVRMHSPAHNKFFLLFNF